MPSISTTTSIGRWLSRIAGRIARPFLCTPEIGSGWTVVRPGSPSSRTSQPAPSSAASTPGQRSAGPKRPMSSSVSIGTVPWVLQSP